MKNKNYIKYFNNIYSLLILASPSDYETIMVALRQLDVPRRQVSVEVLVAEVVLSDDLKFGIEWFINARNNTVGSLRNSPSLLPNIPAVGGVPDVLQLLGAVPFGARDVAAVDLGHCGGRAVVEPAAIKVFPAKSSTN